MSLAVPRPVWRFRGRAYRSITGLYSALFFDSSADSLSAVIEGRIVATNGRRPNLQVVATYSVSAPTVGEEIIVKKEAKR